MDFEEFVEPTRLHWVPDDAASSCMDPSCSVKFSLFTRKHHCRACGKIFCYQHCSQELPLCRMATFHPLGTMSRVCDTCYAVGSRHLEQVLAVAPQHAVHPPGVGPGLVFRPVEPYGVNPMMGYAPLPYQHHHHHHLHQQQQPHYPQNQQYNAPQAQNRQAGFLVGARHQHAAPAPQPQAPLTSLLPPEVPEGTVLPDILVTEDGAVVDVKELVGRLSLLLDKMNGLLELDLTATGQPAIVAEEARGTAAQVATAAHDLRQGLAATQLSLENPTADAFLRSLLHRCGQATAWSSAMTAKEVGGRFPSQETLVAPSAPPVHAAETAGAHPTESPSLEEQMYREAIRESRAAAGIEEAPIEGGDAVRVTIPTSEVEVWPEAAELSSQITEIEKEAELLTVKVLDNVAEGVMGIQALKLKALEKGMECNEAGSNHRSHAFSSLAKRCSDVVSNLELLLRQIDTSTMHQPTPSESLSSLCEKNENALFSLAEKFWSLNSEKAQVFSNDLIALKNECLSLRKKCEKWKGDSESVNTAARVADKMNDVLENLSELEYTFNKKYQGIKVDTRGTIAL